MNRRLLLAVAALLALTVSAGCLGFFGDDEFSEEQLLEDAEYNWETDRDVYINHTSEEYQVVYNVSNQSSMAVHAFGFLGEEDPVEVSAVQFRYENGTVVDASALTVTRKGDETVIELPAKNGQLAYTAPAEGTRTFQHPVFVEGSYELVLPDSMRADIPILGGIRPGGSETEVVGDRMHIRWEEVTADAISVQYYGTLALKIFSGLVAVLGLIGLIAFAYIWLQVRELSQRREELGLDVNSGEDDSRRP